MARPGGVRGGYDDSPMTERHSSADERSNGRSQTAEPLLRSALGQIREDCRLYNEAVGSYNTHLDNHRARRDLHDVPFRHPITAHDAFDDAVGGDRAAVAALLDHLLDQPRLDSRLRRHPRTYPVHIEASEHLRIAREQLVTTLEEALRHLDGDGE